MIIYDIRQFWNHTLLFPVQINLFVILVHCIFYYWVFRCVGTYFLNFKICFSTKDESLNGVKMNYGDEFFLKAENYGDSDVNMFINI